MSNVLRSIFYRSSAKFAIHSVFQQVLVNGKDFLVRHVLPRSCWLHWNDFSTDSEEIKRYAGFGVIVATLHYKNVALLCKSMFTG